jgi:retron-type reverse transcriptase
VSLATPTKLRRLQRALYATAKRDPVRRFHALYDKVWREDILVHAYALSRENGGAPGVDGVTFAQIEAYGVERWLGELREEVRTGRYTPQPVRRVMIPKSGGVGQRPLGIPTIRDRVVQTAAKLVIEPIFEADFDEAAYGYRPRRSAHEAIRIVHKALDDGRTEVVDADLRQYFDTIPHAALLRCLARRISDGRMLHLLKRWLKAPVAEADERGAQRMSGGKRATRGTPQGGVVTPPTQSQTLPGTEPCPTRGSCIKNLDGNDIGHSTFMTHERSATRPSGPVRRARESSTRPVTTGSTPGGSAHAGPPVSRLSASGPAVCGSRPAASPGITRAGADGGVHGEAAGQSGAPAPGTGPGHRREPQFTRHAWARKLAASGAARTRRWRIGASSTTTCLTAWAMSG